MLPKQHLQLLLININTALACTMIRKNFVDGILIMGVFSVGVVIMDIVLAFDIRNYSIHQVNTLLAWCFTIGLMLGILLAYVFVRFSPIGINAITWETFRHAVHWCSYSFLACLGWWRFSHWFFPQA